MSANDELADDQAERHVSRRCPRMEEHSVYLGGKRVLPVPCEDCYSVEAIWRRIPYEPDSRTPVPWPVTAGDQP